MNDDEALGVDPAHTARRVRGQRDNATAIAVLRGVDRRRLEAAAPAAGVAVGCRVVETEGLRGLLACIATTGAWRDGLAPSRTAGRRARIWRMYAPVRSPALNSATPDPIRPRCAIARLLLTNRVRRTSGRCISHTNAQRAVLGNTRVQDHRGTSGTDCADVEYSEGSTWRP